MEKNENFCILNADGQVLVNNLDIDEEALARLLVNIQDLCKEIHTQAIDGDIPEITRITISQISEQLSSQAEYFYTVTSHKEGEYVIYKVPSPHHSEQP